MVALARGIGLTKSTWLRRFALTVLGCIGQHDTTIVHHWVPKKRIRLHWFRHKGYWFYGRAREQATMRAFSKLISAGQTVIELGAHIGYVSLYLADLVGPEGHVYVFEPSPDNLVYARWNLRDENVITLVEKAASDREGVAIFFLENLTGQNSTLIEEYSVFQDNRERAFSGENYRKVEVLTTTVDQFVRTHDLRPHFIKIDVEGAELACLRGSIETLKRFRPRLMVEVTNEADAVLMLLNEAGYLVYDINLEHVHSSQERPQANLFFIHREDARHTNAEGLPSTLKPSVHSPT